MIGPCGGCEGKGAHRRWCPASVGHSASVFGRYAEQAEALGDSVGSNEMGAANHLYAASALLRKLAEARRDEWRSQQVIICVECHRTVGDRIHDTGATHTGESQHSFIPGPTGTAAWQRPFVEAALRGDEIRLEHTRKGPRWAAYPKEET